MGSFCSNKPYRVKSRTCRVFFTGSPTGQAFPYNVLRVAFPSAGIPFSIQALTSADPSIPPQHSFMAAWSFTALSTVTVPNDLFAGRQTLALPTLGTSTLITGSTQNASIGALSGLPCATSL